MSARRARPAALLCDMDGTLVDTEREWLVVLAAELRRAGLPSDAAAVAPLAGVTLADAAAMLIRRGVHEHPNPLSARLDREFTATAERGVTLRPGALDLLDRARAAGVPTALVTASERPFTDLVLKTLGPWRFDATVAGLEHIPHSKPAPDPYLRAASLLNVPIDQCAAVEDTPTGTRSALDAGCVRVYVIPTVPGIPDDPRVTHLTSLTELPI